MSKKHTVQTICYDKYSQKFVHKSAEKTFGANDVLVRTTHSGLCSTDVHAKDKGCGLGHEGIGFVEDLGEAVTNVKIGQRVGWGWLHSSCGHCKTCASGYRQYCAEARGFAFSELDQGAFSDYRVINSAFAYAIPESIESKHAAPLMCAGASTFEALQAAGAKPSDRVGVVGIGGLGHTAIQFAKAMGCGVTAISSGWEKAADAFKLGADEYRCTDDIDLVVVSEKPRQSPGIWAELENGNWTTTLPQPMSIDVLLITSNEVPNLDYFLPLLARRATIVLMTIQLDSISIPYMPFVLPGHRLIASTEASYQNHFEMLAFAAQNRISPWVEEFAMDLEGVAQAFRRLESGGIRYRGVLVRKE